MKKILNILLCGLSLLAIEYFFLLFSMQTERILKYDIPITKFSGALGGAGEISLVRFIFYFVPWVIAVYLIYDKLNIKRPVLKLALVNCGLYILLSVVMTLFFPFAKEYFERAFFYYLILATFMSPFVLGMIPYFNRIIRFLISPAGVDCVVK
jgi:hypothetical protein